jgi:glycosyltransferase involved in cell wall biosynthesis
VTVPNFVQPGRAVTTHPGAYGIYLGRLSSEKGLGVLLQALRIADDPPFRIVGGGPLSSELESQAARLGLANVQFFGQVPHEQIDQILRESRYLVLPSSWNENCPMAALESMAQGRPLLVTERGGLPELTREGAGLVCRADDACDLAKKIRTLVEDEDLCSRAGARALMLARTEFGPDAHLERLEAAYASVTS